MLSWNFGCSNAGFSFNTSARKVGDRGEAVGLCFSFSPGASEAAFSFASSSKNVDGLVLLALPAMLRSATSGSSERAIRGRKRRALSWTVLGLSGAWYRHGERRICAERSNGGRNMSVQCIGTGLLSFGQFWNRIASRCDASAARSFLQAPNQCLHRGHEHIARRALRSNCGQYAACLILSGCLQDLSGS